MTDFCGTCGAYWACACPRGLRLDVERDDLEPWLDETRPEAERMALRAAFDRAVIAEAFAQIRSGMPFDAGPWKRSEAYKQPDPFALLADVILPRLP